SGNNRNIFGNYAAGAGSRVVTAPADLLNLAAKAARMAVTRAEDFEDSDLIDTERLGSRLKDAIYPDRDRNSNLTIAGERGTDVLFIATGDPLTKAGAGALSKLAQLGKEGARRAIQQMSKAAARATRNNCFPPETLVATESGPRAIAEVESG